MSSTIVKNGAHLNPPNRKKIISQIISTWDIILYIECIDRQKYCTCTNRDLFAITRY